MSNKIITYQYNNVVKKLLVKIKGNTTTGRLNLIVHESGVKVEFDNSPLEILNLTIKSQLDVFNNRIPPENCIITVDGVVEDMETETSIQIRDLKEVLDCSNYKLSILGIILHDEEYLSDYCYSEKLFIERIENNDNEKIKQVNNTTPSFLPSSTTAPPPVSQTTSASTIAVLPLLHNTNQQQQSISQFQSQPFIQTQIQTQLIPSQPLQSSPVPSQPILQSQPIPIPSQPFQSQQILPQPTPIVKKLQLLNPEDNDDDDDDTLISSDTGNNMNPEEQKEKHNSNLKVLETKPPTRETRTNTILMKDYSDISTLIQMEDELFPIPLPNLFIQNTNGNTFVSLPTALLYGLNYLETGSFIRFMYKDEEENRFTSFILPFIELSHGFNVMPQRIYFYCIDNVKDHVIVLNNNNISCSYNILIFHSLEPVCRYYDKTVDQEYEIYPFRFSESRTLPAAIETENSKKRTAIISEAIEHNTPLLIENKTSSAKTFSVEQVCIKGQIPLVRYNFGPSSSIDELIGTIVVKTSSVGEPEITYKFGPFSEAFIEGKVLLLDELSLSSTEVIQAILSVLDSKELVIDEIGKGYTKYEMNPHFRIVATQNPAGMAYKRTKLDSTMMSRFRYFNSEQFPDITKEEMKDIIRGFNIQGINDDIINAIVDIHSKAENDPFNDKVYTLRDCIRLITMIKYNTPPEYAFQLIYKNQLPDLYIYEGFEREMKSDFVLNAKYWCTINYVLKCALLSGCHILLYSDDEFLARKYLKSFIKSFYPQQTKNVIKCTSDMTADNLIGTFIISDSANDRKPLWKDSPLLSSIQKGEICILQNLDHMKSNAIERLNSLFEIIPNDGCKHVIRFDERSENPEVEINPYFRLISTSSRIGLNRFSPALLNRFVRLYIPPDAEILDIHKQYPPKFAIDSINYFANNVFKEKQYNFQQWIYKNDVDRSCYNVSYLNDEILDEMLKNLIKSRLMAIYGGKGCGKSSYLDVMFDNAYKPLERKCLYLSGDCEIDQLIGFYTKDGIFHNNVILNAICNGEIIVVEDAQTLSKELMEFFETITDPTTDEFVYLSKSYPIHPCFRVVLNFTNSGNNEIFNSIPSYAEKIEIKEYDKVSKEKIFGFPSELNSVFSLVQMKYLKSICECYEEKYIPYILSLYILPNEKEKLEKIKEIYSNVITIEIEEFLNSEITYNKEEKKLRKVIIEVSCEIEITCNEQWFLECLFKILLVDSLCPLLLVGSNPFKSSVIDCISKNSKNNTIEVSKSYDSSHLLGSTLVTNLSDFLSLISQISSTHSSPQLDRWKKALQITNNDNNKSSDNSNNIFFKPGLITKSLLCNEDIILNHIDLLNDSLYTRYHGILNLYSRKSSLKQFALYEDSLGNFMNYITQINNLYATVDDEDYSKVVYKDMYLPIYCPYPKYEEIKLRFPMYEENNKIQISYYQIAERLKHYLNNENDSLVFVNCISMNGQSKLEMLRDPNNPLLKSSLIDFFHVDYENETISLSVIQKIFSNDFYSKYCLLLNRIKNTENQSLFYVVPTTVQMLVTCLLGFLTSTPVILEGEPGCGKSAIAKYIFDVFKIPFFRINFSPNMTIQELFGSVQLDSETQTQEERPGTITKLLIENMDNENGVGFLFDELNLANTEILDVLSSLLHSLENKTEFYAPGYKSIKLPEKLYIISTLNPASMTGSRTSLSKNIINYCLYFNDITYKLFELLFIGKRMLLETQENASEEEKSSFEHLINNLFEFSLELGKKTGTNYSLREPIKSLSIWESSQFFKADIRSALWIVFGCKFNISDMDSINTILKVNSNTKIKLNNVDDRIIFNGPWSVVIPSNNLSFNRNCFTTSELNLAYKIALSYESKRGIIIYGPSPSGKSYTIRKLAELYKKVLVPVPLNSESTSDMLIGHYELKINSKDDNENSNSDNTNNNYNSKGELVFRNGPLLSAIIEGAWIMIEDVNTASSDILERLNSLCEERPELTLTESGEKITYSCDSENIKYRIHPDFRIFFLFTTDNISLIPAPLLSRCIVLYANTLSTIESCQELCILSEKPNEAQYYGEKSNVDFRKAVRYLNNPNEQTYRDEYGCNRVGGNKIVVDLEIEKTNAEIFIEKMKALYKGDDLVELIEKVVNESILYFSEKNKQQLRNWLNRNVIHMLCYPINLILKTLDKHLDENSTLLNPIYDTYDDFERWLLFKKFKLKPTEECKKLRISPLIDENPPKKLNKYFYGDNSDIIILHYIIGRIDLLCLIPPFGYYKPTIDKIFSEMKELVLKQVDINEMLKCMFDRIEDIDRYIEEGTLRINDVSYNNLVVFNQQLQSENFTYGLHRYKQVNEKIKEFNRFFDEVNKLLSKDINSNRNMDDEKMNEKEAQDILKELDPELCNKFEECFKGAGIKSELLDTIKKYEKLPSLKIKYENIDDENTRLYIQLSHIIYFITAFDKATIPSLIIRYLSVFEKIKIKTKPLMENMYKFEDNKNSFICYINSIMNKIAPLVYLPLKVVETIRYYPLYIHKFIDEKTLTSSLSALYENGFLGNFVLVPDLLLKDFYSLCNYEKYNYIKIDFISKKVIELAESNDEDVKNLGGIWKLDYLRALKPYHFSANNEPGTLIQPSDLQYEYDLITYDSKIKDREMYFVYDIIFKSKLLLNDKLILLSPKYETQVTAVILELLSDNHIKDYLLNEFNNVETVDEIVPSIDKYLSDNYNSLNSEINKKKDDLKREYMNINKQNVVLVTEREDIIKELNKKVKDIVEEKKNEIVSNKETQKRIEMMKWVLTLVYHKSVNNYINSKKSRYPDEVIDISDERLLDSPSYPCFKIAFIKSDDEEITFKLKINSPDPTVLSLDTKITYKSVKSKDDETKYILPFVLPLSNLNIEIIPSSHMAISYKYYPLKINEQEDVFSMILLSKMIENCHKNNVNFKIEEKNINQYEKLDNYYQNADSYLQSIIPPSNKYPIFFNTESKNERVSPLPIKDLKENRVIYLTIDPTRPSYVEDDITPETINSFYKYLQLEKLQLNYYAKDNNDKYYCMDLSCKDYVDRINDLQKRIEENNKRINEIKKLKIEIIEEKKNIPDSPICYSNKIFPPSEEEIRNFNEGDENNNKHIKLSNVILITDIKGYEILLPKNDTFKLPQLIKSRFEPVISIPILNPTNSPITIKETDCKVSFSCDRLEVRFNTLDDGEFTYSTKIVVGSTEKTIKFLTEICDYDNLYFINYPCYISTDNPKVLYYQEEKYHPKDIIVVHYTEDDIVKVSQHFGDRKPIIIGNGYSIMYNPKSVEKVKESTEFYMKRHSWMINDEKKNVVENVVTNIPKSIISINRRVEQLKSKSLSLYISCLHNIFLVGLSSKDDKKDESNHHYIFSVLKYIEENKDNYLNSIYEIVEKNIEYLKSEFVELKWERKYQFGEEDTKLVPQFVQQTSHVSNLQTIEISSKKSFGTKGIKLYKSIRDSELNRIANLYVDPITVVSLKHQKIIADDSEIKTKEIQRRIDITRNEIRSANVRDVLKNFKEYPLDIYFEGILTRINDNEACAIVSLKDKKDMEKVGKYHSSNGDSDVKIEEIRKVLLNYSYDICCGIRNSEDREKDYVKLVTLVIDTSFTHKKYKARLRSLTACLLLIICEEFHIKTRIIASLSHGQAIQISNDDDTLIEKMSEVFDLESIEKMPSTPLDIFAFSNTVKCSADRSNSYFIISDCFSEQLMSECNEVHQYVKEILPSIFLFHIVSNVNNRKDESISKNNIKTMNSKLEYNFPKDHRMIISGLEDFTKTSETKNIYSLFYSKSVVKRVRSDGQLYFPDPSIKESYGNIDIPDIKDDNYTVIIDNSQVINGNIPLPIVNDSDLEYILRGGSSSIYRYINEKIKSGVLFNSLNASVIIPNKPTTWIPSVSGTSIHFQNFIKFLLTKSGDGKIFKKKTGNKVRSYTVSIVLDASIITLSPINISHTLFTFFTLLKGVCELNVPAIDIWISTDKVNKIGAGMISSDAWSSGVAGALNTIIELVNQCNVQNTVLFETMQSAVSTCVARPYSPIMFVLTNYLTMEDTRNDIKELIYSSECKTIGVGVGYSIGDISNIFPSFIWSSNPDNLYKSIGSVNNETPHQYNKCSLSFSTKKQNIVDGNIEIIDPKFVKHLSDIYSAFEYRALFVNTLQTKDENIMKLTAECTSSDYDLGKDGAFNEFNILIVILYLCRGQREKDGKLVDEFITDDVLRRGFNNGDSPIKKLQSKGFNINIVYDYYNATVEIASGKYRTVIITCSDGGGVPDKAINKEFGYITQFIDCLKEYHENGGGIFWLLENHPYSFEANIFFKKVFHINELTLNENIEGGKRMERDDKVNPGKFRTVGQDMFEYNIDSIRIDTGLKYIYEGKTLACLNEKELEKNGFVVFAREHEGHSAIMLKEREGSKGKIVIDTASSKLFLEFTSDGTSRWISNAVIWLLNIDTYFSCNNFSGEVPKTIAMKFKPDPYRIDKTISPVNNIMQGKPVNFCLTVIMDCTGTMKPYVEATKLEIGNIFNEVERIKKDSHLDAKSNILLQFVGYKDFTDKIRYYESYLQPNFIKIKKLLSKVEADGGKDYCEDVSGGVETAIKHLENIKQYKHLIIIIGDEPNHGDGMGDDYPKMHPETKEDWDKVWKRIATKLRELNADVHFMPVNTNHILNTMKRLHQFYPKVYSHDLTDFKSGTFTPLLKNVISVQYKQYIGIS